mmetsp:Transcript_9170/g.17097  ORF Transcript_9170/g.17097 Transcript_9170/m.17097 type:complete len:242 (-) Transcript_9170:1220-1945(-)
MLLNKVAGVQQLVVPFIWQRDCLHRRLSPRLEPPANLLEVGAKPFVAHCLDHLHRDDGIIQLLSSPSPLRDPSVVTKQKSALPFHSLYSSPLVAFLELLRAQRDAGHVAVVFFCQEHGHCSPATSNFQHTVILLDATALDNLAEFAHLHHLQIVECENIVTIVGNVRGISCIDGARVDHSAVQEELVHVIAGIVMLFNVLSTVQDGIGSQEPLQVGPLLPEEIHQTQDPLICRSIERGQVF